MSRGSRRDDTWLQLGSRNGFPEYDTINNKNPFVLVMIDPRFQGIYKSWLRGMLLSANPYSGIPLAQEPAVAMIEIQNEDSFFFWTFGSYNIPEIHMQQLERYFADWLVHRYGSLQNAYATWGDGSQLETDRPDEGRMTVRDVWFMTSWGAGEGAMRRRMRDQREFLTELQRGFYLGIKRILREDIGTRSMVVPSNWTTAQPETMDMLERYTYTAGEVIDRHAYFNGRHEGFGAGWMIDVGQTFEDRTSLRDPDGTIVNFNSIKNYPHMISETGWPNPNRFKGESVPLWSIYGSLQGMDAIAFFALDQASWQGSPNKFTLMTPTIFGQFPAFALIFRQGYLEESSPVVRVSHSLDRLYDFEVNPIVE